MATYLRNLVSVAPHGHTKRPSKSEVGELDVAVVVDEQVLRFEVAMQDAVTVHVVDAVQELISVALKHHNTMNSNILQTVTVTVLCKYLVKKICKL